jgi:hypothetical protein
MIQGLGRESVELPDSYWSVLDKYKLIRTAEQEQRRRFLDAQVVAAPPTHFAQETSRLIRACLRSCPQTSDTSIQFVSAGLLSLQTSYVADERLSKIHERWLENDQATQELGLPTDLTEANVLFHSTKRIFADILDQVPLEAFGQGEAHSNIWHKKRQLSHAEQRLLEYTQMKNGFLLKQSITSHTSLRLEWSGNSSLSDNTIVDIQLHQESCHALRSHLIARDGRFHPSTVACCY